MIINQKAILSKTRKEIMEIGEIFERLDIIKIFIYLKKKTESALYRKDLNEI